MNAGRLHGAMALAAALAAIGAAGAAPPHTTISEGLEQGTMQRIVFLGDSITYDGRYAADFEAWLIARYPDRAIEVIDVGLPSETVSGLSEEGHAGGRFDRPCVFERLSSVLEKTKPDLVFACYGMNCGIYKPFDEDRAARYRDGIVRLHDAVAKAGARIVHLTPPMYDAAHARDRLAEYNDVLHRYSEWLLSKRADGWEVVDIHGPMTREVGQRRASDPEFTFAPDGVHPDDAGHWCMAQQAIAYCGGADAAAASSVDAMLGGRAALLPLVRERMAIMRDAWLTLTGHHHPDIPKGLPMDEAKAKCLPLTAQIEAIAQRKPGK